MHRFSVVVLHKEKLLLLRSKLTMDLVFFSKQGQISEKTVYTWHQKHTRGQLQKHLSNKPPLFYYEGFRLGKKMTALIEISFLNRDWRDDVLFSRETPHDASDTRVGGRCCEVSGNGLDRRCKMSYGGGNEDCIEEESSMSGASSSGGGGHHFTAGNRQHRASSSGNDYEQPVLSERDRKELMSLANENISMDFILEMKEAFQLFDKVWRVDNQTRKQSNNTMCWMPCLYISICKDWAAPPPRRLLSTEISDDNWDDRNSHLNYRQFRGCLELFCVCRITIGFLL